MKAKIVLTSVFLTLNAFFVELIERNDKIKSGFEPTMSYYWFTGLFLIGILSGIFFYSIYQKLKRKRNEQKRFDIELQHKKLELTYRILHLAETNALLKNLKQKIMVLKNRHKAFAGYNQLIKTINIRSRNDIQWKDFRTHFEDIYPNFNNKVLDKYPNVTSNELRLMALLKMDLSSREIAAILNISHDGVKKARYRLRKKLKLIKDDSLERTILDL